MQKSKAMATKEMSNKKELARTLYMSGENQQDIATKVGVSRITINKWVNQNAWKEMRAAKTVTRGELINKMLLNIASMLDKAQDSKEPVVIADQLSKVAAAIEKLDKKSNVVAVVDVCISFSNYVESQLDIDKEVTREFIKTLNRVQNSFIAQRFNVLPK